MQLPTAPIIHARTKDVDFRANLLVVPHDFTPQDVQWARKYIVDSTRYFEMAGSDGRRVVFSNASFVVSGVSIRISDLYRLCGKQPQYDKVDGNRTNYAFIGFVFPRNQIQNPFDISHCVYLDTFEKYMALRWSDSNSPEALMHTRAAYEGISLHEATRVSNVLQISARSHPQVVDSRADTLESFAAQATILAAQQPHFAFCSDISMANCVLESSFTNVTSSNANSINNSIAKTTESTRKSTQPADVSVGAAKEKAKSDTEILQDIISAQDQGKQTGNITKILIAICVAAEKIASAIALVHFI